ncbi:MAG: hypothetical protein QOI55_991, partial [Actinomycetota bacterium]|nr:hypothetical protein [Actinomycetota bacterium]
MTPTEGVPFRVGRGPAVYWDHDKDRFVAVGDDDYVDPGPQPAVAPATAARHPNAHYLVRTGVWTLELGPAAPDLPPDLAAPTLAQTAPPQTPAPQSPSLPTPAPPSVLPSPPPSPPAEAPAPPPAPAPAPSPPPAASAPAPQARPTWSPSTSAPAPAPSPPSAAPPSPGSPSPSTAVSPRASTTNVADAATTAERAVEEDAPPPPPSPPLAPAPSPSAEAAEPTEDDTPLDDRPSWRVRRDARKERRRNDAAPFGEPTALDDSTPSLRPSPIAAGEPLERWIDDYHGAVEPYPELRNLTPAPTTEPAAPSRPQRDILAPPPEVHEHPELPPDRGSQPLPAEFGRPGDARARV